MCECARLPEWEGLTTIIIDLQLSATGILVYTDAGIGASEKCVLMTLTSLRSAVSFLTNQPYVIETTTSDDITHGRCLASCSLLVMPGGRDMPYVSNLQGRGNLKIKEFVQSGGSYLGLCAGGYYGAAFVEFARGDRYLEVVGSRELAFFPGKAQGPTFPGFMYDSNCGAKAARISLTDTAMKLMGSTTASDSSLSTFYNGGCHFVPHTEEITSPAEATNCSDGVCSFEVLATYNEAESSPIAITSCQYGVGRVILSGVHLEASVDLLTAGYYDDDHLGPLLPHLTASERTRQSLFNGIVKYLLHQD